MAALTTALALMAAQANADQVFVAKAVDSMMNTRDVVAYGPTGMFDDVGGGANGIDHDVGDRCDDIVVDSDVGVDDVACGPNDRVGVFGAVLTALLLRLAIMALTLIVKLT